MKTLELGLVFLTGHGEPLHIFEKERDKIKVIYNTHYEIELFSSAGKIERE